MVSKMAYDKDSVERINAAAEDLLKSKDSLKLADETEDVNGTEAYIITCSISGADVNPLYMEMTFNGMTAGEGDEQVTFSKFNMKMEYTNFDTVDAITVPQDVVDSAIDVTDYLNDLQNETSTETETQTESESAA